MKFIIKSLRKIYHFFISYYNHYSIKYKAITIFSNNCIAGFLYNDYRLKFNSPTINLQISPQNFIKFLKNINYYLSIELIEEKEPDIDDFIRLGGQTINFPVGRLDDIVVYFQHYHSFDEAKEKWDLRKKRIIWDKIYVILMDTYCTEDIIEQFFKLDFIKKIFITNKNLASTKNIFCLKTKNSNWYDFIGKYSMRKNYQQFNFKKWLNT
jgi:uncharacterized protein (DUF1919 family)